ncbi:DUF4118 domain-containing protein [Oxalobacter aliiformigenes]|uniref:histidine kinase n=1 Tax=Oxalobacter aliiformigenes TaxID=2946593 RepID=A0ABY7JL73_9BURK|nr:DUF4118 domain-containing protein [Oxalobacter aliiformigenes]WAV93480.1 DUF4118 domain-containing protein [Oxalobacter aliiformigenes]WAV95023.1 DUF4118 domain-containing protein [Oxalobacter aliiformigenes]WAV97175.1 DUF4118 domain-containing protein [Oxalobacter aliiformigenes]
MNDKRPNPDLLLKQVNADEIQATRGHLKIFFGASAGVGKTYAMLTAAHEALKQEIPLVMGIVETHGRTETARLTRDLPRLDLKKIPYRGRVLDEFDLDAALSFGKSHPNALILVDELAHSNVPGSRHPKRWQDVEELLRAGIDVWTTMNVQHLESLNDIVSRITGILVRETVPDRIFDEAEEVIVIDLPPDELIQRLKQGKMYLPEQTLLASKNFFRKGNLLALRELTLRRTADRIDGEIQAYRLRNASTTVWPHRESLLACITPDAIGEKVIRSSARLASQLDVPWHAIYIESPSSLHENDNNIREKAVHLLKLASDLGATAVTQSASDVASGLIRYARDHNLSRLVLGRAPRKWYWPWKKSTAQKIEMQADDLDILQVSVPQQAVFHIPFLRMPSLPTKTEWKGYFATLLICAITTLFAIPFKETLELTNIVMFFLLAVAYIAVRYGRGSAILAAFVNVFLFDICFVPPKFSIAVSDAQFAITFAVMLVVALIIGQLTANLKMQSNAAIERERRVRSLYEMSRDLSAVLMIEQIADIAARFLHTEFGAKQALFIADDNDQLQKMSNATANPNIALVQWAYEHGLPAGLGTDTLPTSPCFVLPLKATMRLRGILAIEPGEKTVLGPEQHRLLDICASLLAISIERIHYLDVAQKTMVQVESERLRNSLLSAISHDLRTPLTALVGLADTLLMTKPEVSAEQKELLDAMRQSALRMNDLVSNLLDMAKLEAGTVHLNKQWQPLEEVVGSALSSCSAFLDKRPITVHLDGDLPLVNIDTVLIERVLVNILENASKYTPQYSPIEISGYRNGDQITLTIDDHGPGLPAGQENIIFEKFERGEKENATPGIGLGLAISKAIMKAHEGKISGESRPDGGARFTLIFPFLSPPEMKDDFPIREDS